MSDQWEALFDLWHERAHTGRAVHQGVHEALVKLEARVVKLEAFMAARMLGVEVR